MTIRRITVFCWSVLLILGCSIILYGNMNWCLFSCGICLSRIFFIREEEVSHPFCKITFRRWWVKLLFFVNLSLVLFFQGQTASLSEKCLFPSLIQAHFFVLSSQSWWFCNFWSNCVITLPWPYENASHTFNRSNILSVYYIWYHSFYSLLEELLTWTIYSFKREWTQLEGSRSL